MAIVGQEISGGADLRVQLLEAQARRLEYGLFRGLLRFLFSSHFIEGQLAQRSQFIHQGLGFRIGLALAQSLEFLFQFADFLCVFLPHPFDQGGQFIDSLLYRGTIDLRILSPGNGTEKDHPQDDPAANRGEPGVGSHIHNSLPMVRHLPHLELGFRGRGPESYVRIHDLE